MLLGGEPGSGKSRLVREFAHEVARDGALVLYGAGDAVARTPYGPFTQAFEHLVQVVDSVELRSAVGNGAGRSLACSQICRSGLVGRLSWRGPIRIPSVIDSTPR